MVPLMKGKDYRISFFASPVFNNRITFRIIDTSSGDKVLDLPGEVDEPAKGNCVLREYLDPGLNKMVHPYFDFQPTSSINLKIIIDIASKEKRSDQVANNSGGSYKVPEERDKGCITVFIQDKTAEDVGF